MAAPDLLVGANSAKVPPVVERKGSLCLRSEHMKYGRATLNSNWHCDREAEPKDYDINEPQNGKRNLLKATYTRIGNQSSNCLTTTTKEAMAERELLQKDFQETCNQREMIVLANFTTADQSISEGVSTDVLPQHNQDRNKYHLETTHKADYTVAQHKVLCSAADNVTTQGCSERNNRRKLSEFTETDGHRRHDLSIWQDF